MLPSAAIRIARTASMSLGEFALIDRFFRRPLPARDDVLVGIGDDGAVLRVGQRRRLVTTLAVAGSDIGSVADAASIGHDVMAGALNRLAAAGAQPAWATLALTLPEADERWLAAFSDALFAIADACGVSLIGGDTTRGPFAVTVVGHGLLDDNSAKIEPRIAVGDGIYVSGALGAGVTGKRSLPATIRVALGSWIRSCGGVAVDLSEGLAAALAQLLADEAPGARLELARLPLEPAARRRLDDDDAWSGFLHHRGDTELLFTLPAACNADLLARATRAHIPVTRVASVDDSGAVILIADDGRSLAFPARRPGAAWS
jgi:thiamine-monophosphate kinase